ncbi:MAG: 5'/3'-nucleotidase SurE [Candidatus Aminicenantes bacterium]|nr:5'/3'-nucleotidase SurE [Candidatus Aminicenantes bacterium]
MKTILLTNDDGFYSKGIVSLKDALEKKYQVWIVAPDREKSAISMALTLNHPLRINQIETDSYAVNGTTADCVNIALQKILPAKPDFIVSGMNLGENLSEDIFFSGTVGGAFCGYLYGIPSLAVSLIAGLGQHQQQPFEFKAGAEITAKILDKLLAYNHENVVYNLNIPFPNNGQIAVTTLGSKRYTPDIIERLDPRGRKYYWTGTGTPNYDGLEGSDIWAVQNKMISLSIIKYDLNAKAESANLSSAFERFKL